MSLHFRLSCPGTVGAGRRETLTAQNPRSYFLKRLNSVVFRSP